MYWTGAEVLGAGSGSLLGSVTGSSTFGCWIGATLLAAGFTPTLEGETLAAVDDTGAAVTSATFTGAGVGLSELLPLRMRPSATPPPTSTVAAPVMSPLFLSTFNCFSCRLR